MRNEWGMNGEWMRRRWIVYCVFKKLSEIIIFKLGRQVVQVYKDGVLSVGPCYWSVNSHYHEDLLTRSDKCLLDVG